MGKVLAKKIRGMNLWAKVALVTLCTLLLSVFMYEGWYRPNQTQAAVSASQPFPNTPTISGTTAASVSGSYTVNAGSNRLLVVSVSCSFSAAPTSQSVSATYGGQALTQMVVSDVAQRRFVWTGYLKEAGIAAASGTTLQVTLANNTSLAGTETYAAVFTGVDQTTPVNATYSYYNNNANAILDFGAGLAVSAGGYSLYGVSVNNGTAPTVTGDTGYTLTTMNQIAAASDYSFTGSKAFVSAGTADPVNTFGATIRGGIAAATLNPSVTDTTPPTVTAFTMPSTATSTTVNVSSFTATDAVGVTGYMITESATAPAAGAAGWTATAPTSFTFAGAGARTAYAWAKDAAGNVSTSRSANVTITLPDTTAPTVDVFTMPATATSTTVGVTSFTASDAVGVTGYMITESATAPAAADAGWNATAPTSFTFAGTGARTAYAWAKDAAGNVSTSRSASVTISAANGTTASALTFSGITYNTIVVTAPFSGDSNANNTCVIKWGTVNGTYPNTATATKSGNSYVATVAGLSATTTYYFQATFTDADGVTGSPVAGSQATVIYTNPLMHSGANLGTKYSGGTWGAGKDCSWCHSNNTPNIKRIAAQINTPTGLRNVTFSRMTASLNSTPGVFGNDNRTYALNASTNVCEVCHHQTTYHQYSSTKIATKTHNNNKECVACHVHAKGFAAGGCDSCHGNPPGALVAPATGVGSAGAHATHTAKAIDCNACHTGTTMPTTDNAITIGFNVDGTTWTGFPGSVAFGSYSGKTLNVPYSFASGNAGTTVRTAAAGRNSCNVYCHGNWTGANGSLNASWTITDGTQKACGTCHGTTAAQPPASNAHPTHAGQYAKACNTCHGTLPTDNTHVNGNVAVALATGTYSRTTGIANPSAATGTCSATYCHSDGTSVSTGTVVSKSSPAWNTTAGCNVCHGAVAADGRPEYANNTPKANSHQAATHLAQTCDICHDSVTYNAGSYTPNVTLHNNGAYNIKSTLGYTFAAGGGTCATAGCHGSAQWGGVLGCINCHNTTITRTKGRAAGTTLAAVTTEFGLAYGHKKTGRGAVTDADCVVCHLEGYGYGGANAGKANPTYHQNGDIDLRDPRGSGDTPITNISGAAFTFQRFSTSYAAGSRTSTGHQSNTDIANVITQKFCLACHRSGGATNTTARTAGGTAYMPWGGVNLGANYTVANGATVAGGVVNVFSQFSTANSSYHPVRGPLNRDFPAATRLNPPYNNNGSRAGTSGTKTLSVVLNCFDCHNTPAPLTRRTVVAHGNAAELRGTIYTVGGVSTLCTTCHIGYTVSGTHSTGSAWSATGSSHNVSRNCQDCHGSYKTAVPARPLPAQDYHGNNALVGGGLWPTVNSRPYAFIRAWSGTAYHRPFRATEFTTGSATCGAGTCPSGGSGGQVGDGSTRTYTPGGSY